MLSILLQNLRNILRRRVVLGDAVRQGVKQMGGADSNIRLNKVRKALGIGSSTWYRPTVPVATSADKPKRRGPVPLPVEVQVVGWVMAMALVNPWYGYKRMAVMCRRAGQPVTNRQCYRVMKQH